jgi:hypothetical protein
MVLLLFTLHLRYTWRGYVTEAREVRHRHAIVTTSPGRR